MAERTEAEVEALVALADRVQQVLAGHNVAQVFDIAMLVLANAALQIDYTEEEFVERCARGHRLGRELQIAKCAREKLS